MENVPQLLSLGAIALIILWGAWILIYGLRRGSLAIALRCLWTLPVVCAFFPELITIDVPSSISVKPIHVLLDDSDSMKKEGWYQESLEIINELKGDCARSGCQLKVSPLSKRDPSVEKGFSPINEVMGLWSYEVGAEPWLVLTDGGKTKPGMSWDDKLKAMGQGLKGPRGMIVGFKNPKIENIWIDSSEDTVFSFEGKNVVLAVDVYRSQSETDLPVQVQISSGADDQHLATSNIAFRQGETHLNVEIPLPPLARGNHFLNIEVLPTASETILWDNQVHRNVEVLPNTIGVLHLLGSPSWDGRFVRRYLKSEPKYDLISFFILRDPVDHQLTNERELSLIPFPVDRLFNQELPNFRSVIIQNFSLYQFLEPNYQNNLVKFVKDGGGVLFIGGPRALSNADYQSSALASILPFEVIGPKSGVSPTNLLSPISVGAPQSGPYYDPDLKFTIEAADPDENARDLANVYDDWLQVLEDTKLSSPLSGLHHMENVRFKKGEHTPLLNARTEDGRSIPLAVASYPGKGRALWIFF